jgi:hypothetical protein
MKVTKMALAAVVGVVLLAGGVAAQQGMPAAPKPGPEQAILKQDEGTGTRRWRCSWRRAHRP